MKTLLTVDSNAKTVKGQEFGFMTGILYMAPADISGRNVCPMAEIAGCKDACLYSAGRGAMNSVQAARIRKAKAFFENRQEFMSIIVKDINRLIKSAAKKGMIPLVRLNGTSDIRWETVRFNHKGQDVTIFDVFPNVQFYDYTKISNRKDIPANYDLTFSYSGRIEYFPHVQKAIAHGMRIAAVFRTREMIPAKFMGLECVDGDNSDIRHLDPQGVIVALYAKGKAKKDNSGFVVDTLARTIPIVAA